MPTYFLHKKFPLSVCKSALHVGARDYVEQQRNIASKHYNKVSGFLDKTLPLAMIIFKDVINYKLLRYYFKSFLFKVCLACVCKIHDTNKGR